MKNGPFDEIPKDVVKNILKFLSEKDIARFKQVCKAVNNKMNSPRVDLFWQPYLNSLHQIDKTVPIKAPHGVDNQSAWRYGVFIAHFPRVQNEQISKLSELLNSMDDPVSELNEDLNQKITKYKDKMNTVESLQERQLLIRTIQTNRKTLKTDLGSFYFVDAPLSPDTKGPKNR